MLLFLIGLTLLYGLLCLVALVSIAGALLSSLRRARQGTPTLALLLPRQQRKPTKSNDFVGKRAERRKAW